MPIDVDIAKALATDLNDQDLSFPFVSEFNYDPFIDADRVDEILIRTTVDRDERNRESRVHWIRSAWISVYIVAPQQINTTASVDADTDITALLDFWDEVVDYIQNSTPAGNIPVSIDSVAGLRFDREVLHNDRQFRAGVTVSYKVI